MKIAADHFPETRVIATGSSTLDASVKFRDTLTGRRETVWLTPMIAADLAAFGDEDLPHRFLRGGLPPHFLATDLPERDFQDWIDAYWAKDVQELFRLERRWSFQRFVELLLAQSGDMFEATRFAAPCEVSRQTISNYLAALETTFVVQVVRPYSTRRATEIVSAPRSTSYCRAAASAVRSPSSASGRRTASSRGRSRRSGGFIRMGRTTSWPPMSMLPTAGAGMGSTSSACRWSS